MTDESAAAPAPRRRRLPLLTRFVLMAFGGVIVLTLLWTRVSPWLSYPVGPLAHVALEQFTPMWINSARTQPGQITVDTPIEITDARGRKGAVTLEADPGRYAFGLPIFLALLLAAWGTGRAPGRLWRAAAGYVLLLPVQTFSLVMFLLMQLANAAQFNERTLRVDEWQVESIIYGYQLGVLMLPTLTPVLVWLLLDRRFFMDVIVHGWKQSLQARKQRPAATANTPPSPPPPSGV
jgi:hypothetical protein